MTIKRLNRYTSLPVLLDVLERKRLVLIDPLKTWDDKNDTLIIEAYKEKANVKKLFALCFSYESETIHHWKTYANGSSGCCIEFEASKLFEIFRGIPALVHKVVHYEKINNILPELIKIEQIPFTKREPYTTENEYRLIWQGDSDLEYFEIDIMLDSINRITFSQQMPELVFESVKSLLIKNYPILNTRINRSTIYENKTWVKKFKSL
jgi:hypothetical protein